MTHRSLRNKPPRLAVTGGIGSGKSTALALLRELGAATLSSDDLVHEILERPGVVAVVADRYPDVVSGDHVDRTALGRIVFLDDEARIWLERLLHPEVRRGVEQWIQAQCAKASADLLAVEVPLLFESGMMLDLFDAVLLVTAPVDVRRRRVSVKRTKKEFDRRVAQQMGEDQKAERSDYVIENTGSVVRLAEDLADVYAGVLAARPRARNRAATAASEKERRGR